MSYKETFNLDYGMNKWESGFEPIKPDNSEVKPFINIAAYLLQLACEMGAVKKIEVRETIRTGVKYPIDMALLARTFHGSVLNDC